jgi:hypothetical protein
MVDLIAILNYLLLGLTVYLKKQYNKNNNIIKNLIISMSETKVLIIFDF